MRMCTYYKVAPKWFLTDYSISNILVPILITDLIIGETLVHTSSHNIMVHDHKKFRTNIQAMYSPRNYHEHEEVGTEMPPSVHGR